MAISYPNFELISFSNKRVIRDYVGCYGNEHLNSHVLEFKKCFTRYLWLKCINNKYLCQKQRIVLVLRRTDTEGIIVLI